jgi:hypothetical protein
MVGKISTASMLRGSPNSGEERDALKGTKLTDGTPLNEVLQSLNTFERSLVVRLGTYGLAR